MGGLLITVNIPKLTELPRFTLNFDLAPSYNTVVAHATVTGLHATVTGFLFTFTIHQSLKG